LIHQNLFTSSYTKTVPLVDKTIRNKQTGTVQRRNTEYKLKNSRNRKKPNQKARPPTSAEAKTYKGVKI